MKNHAWVLQLRQLLFEQRVVGIWMGHERLNLCLALHRWHAFSTATQDAVAQLTAQLVMERKGWAEELGRERALSLKRGERDALLLQQLQDKLSVAEGLATSLRADVVRLKQEAEAAERQHHAALQQHRQEENERAVAWARTSQQEAVLRAQLDVEQLRLQEASEQLLALEQVTDDAAARMLTRHAVELRQAREAWADAIATFRAARSPQSAWRALRAHVHLHAVRERHAAQEEELESGRRELNALRDGRGALEWRVTESRAKLILLAGATDDAEEEGVQKASAAEQNLVRTRDNQGDRVRAHGMSHYPGLKYAT